MTELDYRIFFPYLSFRVGQEEIINKIENVFGNKGHFILVAPNGTGKSVIALSSVLPLVYKNNLKLIYLCRTYQQNDRIIEELRKIKNKQNYINGISLRGRSNLCINKNIRKENPDLEELTKMCEDSRNKKVCCEYYKEFKLDEHLQNELENLGEITEPTSLDFSTQLTELLKTYENEVVDINNLIDICEKKKICPYYFIRALIKGMRIIVCNYLWVFHPFILNNVLLPEINKNLSDCIIIIDECHNLTDTVLEINEVDLPESVLVHSKALLNKYRKVIINRDHFRSFEKFVFAVESKFREMELSFNKLIKKNKDLTEHLISLNSSELLITLSKMAGIENCIVLNSILIGAEDFISEIYQTEQAEQKRVLRNWLMQFRKFWLKMIRITKDETLLKTHFIGHYFERVKNIFKSILQIRPLDPQDFIKPVLQNCYSSLHLSGTLIPEVYINLTGLKSINRHYELEIMKSPFKKENIKAIIVKGVTSAYKQRKNLETFIKINQKIEEIISAHTGNIGIFCVSYKFLKKLNSTKLGNWKLDSIIKRYNRSIFKEGRNINNAKMIKTFKQHSKRNGAVLLGVLGGKNSEGEDFPGKDMETVIIVGFPFLPKNAFIQTKISYFNEKFQGKGNFYAYIEPAIRKSNQAAGRPIRKEDDKGAIIFLDYRYSEVLLKSFLSKWLNDEDILAIVENIPGVLEKDLKSFWNS